MPESNEPLARHESSQPAGAAGRHSDTLRSHPVCCGDGGDDSTSPAQDQQTLTQTSERVIKWAQKTGELTGP